MKGNENDFILPSNSTGFILAYRGWTYDTSSMLGSWLGSLSCGYIWPKGKPAQAASPLSSYFYYSDADAHSGIFAVSLSRLLAGGDTTFSPLMSRPNRESVTGLVALWGEVIEHREGYRAQYAYPISLGSASAAQTYNVKHIPTKAPPPFPCPFEGGELSEELMSYVDTALERFIPHNKEEIEEFLRLASTYHKDAGAYEDIRQRQALAYGMSQQLLQQQTQQMQQSALKVVPWPVVRIKPND